MNSCLTSTHFIQERCRIIAWATGQGLPSSFPERGCHCPYYGRRGDLREGFRARTGHKLPAKILRISFRKGELRHAAAILALNTILRVVAMRMLRLSGLSSDSRGIFRV